MAPTETPPTTEAGGATEQPTDDPVVAEPDEITVAIGETVWFEGFTIDLEEAVIPTPPLESMDYTVVVTATAENLVPDTNERPPGFVTLEVGDEIVRGQSDRPLIEGGERAEFQVLFEVPRELDPETGVVVVGDEDTLQRRVPLDGGAAFTGAPVELDVPDPITYDGFEMVFEVAEVHFDPPYQHRGAFEGRAYLWLEWTATNETDEATRRPTMGLLTPGGADLTQSGRDGSMEVAPGESHEARAHWEFEIDESGTFMLVGGGFDTTELFEIEIPPLLDD